MSRELAAFRSLKDLARREFILPGTGTCAGCGGLDALRLAAKVLGERVVYVKEAKAHRGPKLFLAAAPCPTGWEYEPARTIDVARLQVETGLFALKASVGGAPAVHTHVPARRRLVREYLIGQGRFRHLFEPVEQTAVIACIQEDVDRYWALASGGGA